MQNSSHLDPIFIHGSSEKLKYNYPSLGSKFISIYIVSVAYIFYISYVPFSNGQKINNTFYESQFDLLSLSIPSPRLLYPSRSTILKMSKQAILHREEMQMTSIANEA